MIYLGNGIYSDSGPDTLAHYGVLGMKWGVRNGPPYPLDNTVYSGGRQHLTKEEKAKNRAAKREERRKKALARQQEHKHDKNKTMDHVDRVLTVRAAVFGNPLAIAALIKDAHASSALRSYIRTRSKKGTIDKKNGLYLKHKDFTKEQDCKIVNPTKASMSSGSHSNCMLCTVSYDLRRRGYDVIANYDLLGNRFEDLKRWYPKAKVDHTISFDRPKTASSWRITKEEKEKFKEADIKYKEKFRKTISELSKQEGTRGNFSVTWMRGGIAVGGHSMAYEVKDGKVSVYDAQSGKVYPDITNSMFANRGKADNLRFTRLDNITPDYKAIKKDGVIL